MMIGDSTYNRRDWQSINSQANNRTECANYPDFDTEPILWPRLWSAG